MAEAGLLTVRDVEAPLTYLVNTGERPVNHASVAGGRDESRGGTYETHTFTVRDGRPSVERIGLDTEGFKLVRHVSQVGNFFDDDEIAARYEAEIADLLKKHTGAAHVVVFDHTRRADSADIRQQKVVREPGRSMHNDYTERSAPQRVRDILGEAEAADRLQRRFAIVNVWRPITRPVETAPIALCDARSIAPADLVATERRAPGRIGEIYQLAYNPAHRWYYFPQMQLDEALLIKVYDSATDGRARLAAHGAFDDPTTPPDAPPRESIESRTFVFF